MYQVEVAIDGVVYPSYGSQGVGLHRRKSVVCQKGHRGRSGAFREESHFPGYLKNHTKLKGKTGSLS